MLYAPWETQEEQDAAYFACFVIGVPFKELERYIRNLIPEIRSGMADMGRGHRAACHRGLSALIDKINADKRLLPVVPNG